MRKLYAALAVIGIVFLLVPLAGFKLEINRVNNLCRSSHSRVETEHDAIDALRNYQIPGDSGLVSRALSRVRHLDAFHGDGYSVTRTGEPYPRHRKGGGWQVKEWTKPHITRGYTVDFDYYDAVEFRPAIDIKCDVYECGAIDVSNCLVFGPE